MTLGLRSYVVMTVDAVCLTVALVLLIGPGAFITALPSSEATACTVYVVKQSGFPHRSLPYRTSSRTLHLSTLTSPALLEKREFSLNIKLRNYREILVYVYGDVLSVRLNNTLLANGTLPHSLQRRSAYITNSVVADTEAAARRRRQRSANRHLSSFSHPVGSAIVNRDTANQGLYILAPPEYATSPKNISKNSASGPRGRNGDEQDPDSGLENEEEEVEDWLSLTVQVTEQLIVVRRFGASSAIVVGLLPPTTLGTPFSAEAFVSSTHAMAVTFDCVSGCPEYTAALEGVSFPLLNPGPPLLLFLCLDVTADGGKYHTLDIHTGQCLSHNNMTATNFGLHPKPSFSFAVTTTRGGSSPQCVNISLKRSSLETSFVAQSKNASTNGSTSDQEGICSFFKLTLEQATAAGGIRVSITPDRDSLRHSVSVVLEGPVTPLRRVYFTPLAHESGRFSINCIPDSHMVASAPSASGAKECSGAGLAWSLATLALLAVALLAAAFVVFVRPNCRYRWEELEYDPEEERSHFVVPVPDDEVSQFSDGTSLADPRQSVGGGGSVKNGGHKPPVTHALVFSQLREAEEVSEPGSPPAAPENQSFSSCEGLECVSGLTTETTIGLDILQQC